MAAPARLTPSSESMSATMAHTQPLVYLWKIRRHMEGMISNQFEKLCQ